MCVLNIHVIKYKGGILKAPKMGNPSSKQHFL